MPIPGNLLVCTGVLPGPLRQPLICPVAGIPATVRGHVDRLGEHRHDRRGPMAAMTVARTILIEAATLIDRIGADQCRRNPGWGGQGGIADRRYIAANR